jgi:hypothetical protein
VCIHTHTHTHTHIYKIMKNKPYENRASRRPRRRWEDIVKMVLNLEGLQALIPLPRLLNVRNDMQISFLDKIQL